MQLLSLWTNSGKAKIFPSATLVKIEKTKTKNDLVKSLKGADNRFVRSVVKDMQDFGEGQWFSITVTEKQAKHFVFFIDETMTTAAVRLRKSHEGKVGYYDFVLDVSVSHQVDNPVYNFYMNEIAIDAELEAVSPIVDTLVDTKDELAEANAKIAKLEAALAASQKHNMDQLIIIEKQNATIEFHRSKNRNEKSLVEKIGEEKAEHVIEIESQLNDMAGITAESEIETDHMMIDFRIKLNEKPSITRGELHQLGLDNPIKFAITKKKINDGEIELKDFE